MTKHGVEADRGVTAESRHRTENRTQNETSRHEINNRHGTEGVQYPETNAIEADAADQILGQRDAEMWIEAEAGMVNDHHKMAMSNAGPMINIRRMTEGAMCHSDDAMEVQRKVIDVMIGSAMTANDLD